MRTSKKRTRWCPPPWAAVTVVLVAATVTAGPAFGLSEIKRDDLPPADGTIEQRQLPSQIPLPEGNPPSAEPNELPPAIDEGGAAESGHALTGDDRPVPEVLYDTQSLPAPVRRMRELIMEACITGDLEALRPLIGTGANITQLAFGGVEEDPIDYLRQLSGDEGGQEILAILLELLEAGYVHIKEDSAQELYVWPYFFAVPIEKLDERQRVELFKVVTAGDFEDMRAYGSYIFYRTAISPEGRWVYFLAGD